MALAFVHTCQDHVTPRVCLPLVFCRIWADGQLAHYSFLLVGMIKFWLVVPVQHKKYLPPNDQLLSSFAALFLQPQNASVISTVVQILAWLIALLLAMMQVVSASTGSLCAALGTAGWCLLSLLNPCYCPMLLFEQDCSCSAITPQTR